MPDLLGDGQNLKNRDKDDKGEGEVLYLSACYVSKCTET